jgi:predicted RNA-binding Zn ribbon-like protein
MPAGVGWQHFAASLLLICYRGHIAGEIKRLKTCPSRTCNLVFFDRSPNNSASWHDVRVCGNRANVRAYRQRMRAGT